jgi:hypothetical protein
LSFAPPEPRHEPLDDALALGLLVIRDLDSVPLAECYAVGTAGEEGEMGVDVFVWLARFLALVLADGGHAASFAIWSMFEWWTVKV